MGEGKFEFWFSTPGVHLPIVIMEDPQTDEKEKLQFFWTGKRHKHNSTGFLHCDCY